LTNSSMLSRTFRYGTDIDNHDVLASGCWLTTVHNVSSNFKPPIHHQNFGRIVPTQT
jgi:hypothetical protein